VTVPAHNGAVATCYQCVTIRKSAVDGIGVCGICNSLACAQHGGLPRNRPAFHCSRCIPGLLTQSAGGSPPSGPGPGGGAGTPGSGPPTPGGGTGGAAVPAFQSSLDFELQAPDLAQASADQRGAVELDTVRESVRRLFGLYRDERPRREDFLGRIAYEVREPVQDEVGRQMRQRPNAYAYWEERGGLDGATSTEVDAIVERYRRWLIGGLLPWMVSIHPVLDENVWVGARDEPGGMVDVLLLADAIGLQAYSWSLDPQRSPFRRLDVVAGADPGLVVLAELYAQSIPAYP